MTQEEIFKRLVGRTVKEVEILDGTDVTITFDDESFIVPLQDKEGNAPGALYCYFPEQEEVQIL